METLVSEKTDLELKLDTIKAEMLILLLKDIVTDDDVVIGKKLIDQWKKSTDRLQVINQNITIK